MKNFICYFFFLSGILYCGTAFSENPIRNEPDGILELPTEMQEAEIRKLDTELAQRIHERLSSEWSSKGFRYLSVKVNYGIVSLKGLVETEKDKQKVENKIKNMAGVRKFESQIRVLKPGEDPMDDSMLQDGSLPAPVDEQMNQKY